MRRCRALSLKFNPVVNFHSIGSRSANRTGFPSVLPPAAACQLRSSSRPSTKSASVPKWTEFNGSIRCSSTSILHQPTIYALSTAPGRAAIAIIRVSGPKCLDIYHALCPGKAAPKPRYATLRALYEPNQPDCNKQILDSGALVLYFPASETVTGEDVLEFHVHGGPAIVKAVLAAIPKVAAVDGDGKTIRYADPGEFTKRAFYNNRLDLTQVEALSDALSAETEQQRRLAIRGSNSALAARYEGWRQNLVAARGELEALIDFSEDQHFDESPAMLCASVATQVLELQQQLRASIQSASRGELLRNGINIALVGAPNAGKSSLLNRILGRQAAIVSEQAGTTRDVLDASVDIGGYLCRFGDLAGLRQADGDATGGLSTIEEEGMRRARSRALSADVVIAFLQVDSASHAIGIDAVEGSRVYLGQEVEAILEQLDPISQKVVCVLNKADLFPDQCTIDDNCYRFSTHPAIRRHLETSHLPVMPISCREYTIPGKSDVKAHGVEPLLEALAQLFGSMTEAVLPAQAKTSGSDSFWTESLGSTERQRVLLQQCSRHLDTFLIEVRSNRVDHDVSGLESNGDEDEQIDILLAAEHLRSAASCLAKITGKGEMAGDVEEVLGAVFEKFCIGK